MLKLAVIGAQTLLGRELVQLLETQDCSVAPLSAGTLTQEEEEGDLVVLAPVPSLLEGLDIAILTDTLKDESLLADFPGRILDLRASPDASLETVPLTGTWPEGRMALKGRPAIEQVLALLPSMLSGIGDVSGTHMRSVANLGDKGIDGLMDQTIALLKGEEPDLSTLGYRGAFEAVPQPANGHIVEIKIPVFHGDLLVLHLRAADGATLERQNAPEGCAWVDQPPTSRDVAVSSELLAHFSRSADGKSGTLLLGFDPILWGALRPVMRLLGFPVTQERAQ